MKKFLSRAAIITSLFLFIIVIIFGTSDFLIRQRKQHFLKLNKDISILFIGNSNVECAINDSLVSHSINVAQSGDAYMYSYYKIKSLLEYNNQIKTIFLGYSYLDVVLSTEQKWMFLDEFVIDKIGKYNYLMTFPETFPLLINNPAAYFIGMRDCIKYNMFYFNKTLSSKNPNIHDFNFGAYIFLVRDKLEEDKQIYLKENHDWEKSNLQIKYLQMISQLCQQKTVKLILLNTPKHKFYTSKINTDLKDYWNVIPKTFGKDSVMDFSEYNLPDSCYGDLMHLNYKGAKIFSEYLNEKINSVSSNEK